MVEPRLPLPEAAPAARASRSRAGVLVLAALVATGLAAAGLAWALLLANQS